MLRDNDLAVPGVDSKQEEELAYNSASGFDNSQWGGLSGSMDSSKFPNQESMTNMLFVDRLGHHHNHPSGSGMVGNPVFMNSGNSSSSSINEYANSFLSFGSSYSMYEGYPPHFSGHTMPQQQLSSNHHDPSLLQYNDAETNPQFKPEIFDPTSFNQSSNSFDHDPRKEKHYFKTNDNLIPPSATPPSEPIDHESFDSTPSGGMGGFVSNWGYENNSTGSIPLSMMHSPLRNTSSSFGLPLPITSDSINGPQPPPHFMGPGFQFTSQLYTAHPQLHDTDPSNFAIADPSFMMFYGGRMGSGLSSTEDQQINGNGSTEMMMMPPPSSTRSAQQQQQQTQQQQQQQPQQRQHTERRRIPLPTNTTNRTARTSRGQIMVLKDSGDMIAEPDDEANDSGYRHSVPRRYMCSVCSKRFTRPSTLRTHMNSHTGERPYHCPSKGCEWKFTVLSNLKRHMRICTGLKRGSDDLVGATIHEVCELEGATDGDWKP